MRTFLEFRAIAVALLVGCASPPDGLRETPKGPGPVIVVDWDAEPLPEIPFPNDLAARADPDSITGLRLNISEEAPTELEARARRKLNELVGFGIYSTITVSFDAPLDLDEIIARHVEDGNHSNDVVLLIDVTPGSPDYLKPVHLDIGHGRFPQDVNRTDVYFPNDSHIDVPSVLFDTHDEDLNGNGKLDWGEDVDNDGWLDVPNVHPEGGDPREDLLSWYEKLTDTFMFRPAVPLREETRYAVVLTENLVGTDGNPVRSPWEYVNHTRQTDALQPVLDGLDKVGMGVNDIAYAWVFTTGRVTGDMVDLRRSLDSEGPWGFLVDEVPPGVDDAVVMHHLALEENKYSLPLSALTTIIGASGLAPEEALDVIREGYDFADGMVGGHFTTPDLLADRDDGGADAVDEWWELDPVAGTVSYQPAQIAFTCVVPKETEEHKQPFPVAIWGHGYGSSRFDTFLFAWAFQRHGIAVCGIDFPGHGPTLDEDERVELLDLLEPLGLMPVLDHVEDSRYVDTNNDGVRDSGSHQWTADAFHTRDNVRQAVLDWMWMVHGFQRCGQGNMKTEDGPLLSCDWDGNGVPDIGTEDVDYLLVGGSLGGIVNGVAVPVMPDVVAHAPIVAGGGLMDISTRAPTGGAVEAMHGKVMTPLFHGQPDDSGGLQILQHVNDYMDMNDLPVATLAQIPAGGRIVVENLANGEVREGMIPEDGRFRVSIPADALDYYERRAPAGIPDTNPDPEGIYTVPGNAGLGDPLVVTIYDADGVMVDEIDRFREEGAKHQGVTYPVDSPLVAGASGLGRIRGEPSTRRLVQVVAMATEPGDPISYARHYINEPFKVLGGKPVNVLIMPTPGDMVVSINSEIALARAAGMVEMFEPDPRYGMTVDQWLIDRQVVRGLEEWGPFTDIDGNPALFDADDLDDGLDAYGAASDDPLRYTVETSSGVSGLRIPYVNPNGSHAFGAPDPALVFDINTFALNQIARYLSTRGQVLSDELCMEDNSCEWMQQVPAESR